MVGVKKFSAIAAVSAIAVTGAAASLQPSEASYSQHIQSHRRHLQNQQQPSLIKIQKRLGFTVPDGPRGIINGIGKDLGLNGGQPSSSANSPPPASTSRPVSNNNNGDASSNNPAPAPSSSPAPASTNNNNNSSNSSNNNNNSNYSNNNSAGNTNNNQNRPATSSSSSSSSNSNSNTSGGSRGSEANQSNGSNRGSSNTNSQPQAAAASVSSAAAPTSVNSAIAAASASASAASASLLSAASLSQASAEAAASAAAATLNGGAASSAASAAATGANRANSSGSSSGSDGTTKVVVPIIVIAASVALIAVAWTAIHRIKKRKDEQYDPRMQPVESSYHHCSMMDPSLAARGAAFAVGGAAAGLVRDRPRRDSYESFEAGRPMSSLTEEEGELSGNAPPMQEVAPYAAVSSAYAPASSRLRNYGSARGGNANGPEDFPAARRVTDSMHIDDYAGDEHDAYDVNYYDGSSNVGYNNKATRGLDAAGVSSNAGRPYSPYADVQRGEAGDEYYDYDRAFSSRRDPFADSERWSG
ncbi:hypothetical protein NDA13_003246 [Ustilago tritici]|nr:hypothetical protein NDA13_003246 [Ustilago tritici]